MSCDKETRRDVLLLASGLLEGNRAAAAQRHTASCPYCSALRLAALEERAALKEAGAPLLTAPDGFAARVAEAAAGAAGDTGFALAAAALAAALAVAVVFIPQSADRSPAPPGPSLTAKFVNPSGASVPGGVSGTDLLYRLSARTSTGLGAGPAPLNLKEGL